MLAAIYDGTGRIVQVMQGGADAVRATAAYLGCEVIELAPEQDTTDLDTTHRVEAGELVAA